MNENRDLFHPSEFDSVVGSRRHGSSAILTARGRVDCGMPEGCRIEWSPIRFKIDLKPKGPSIFASKSSDNIEV